MTLSVQCTSIDVISFIHLAGQGAWLSKAAIPSIPHDYFTLHDEGCKMERKLWHHFLSSQNSITFFYDDQIAKPEDIQLFSDAALSVSFSGYNGGRWFSAKPT